MDEAAKPARWSRSLLSLPLWLLVGGFLVAGVGNVLLVVALTQQRHSNGNLIAAYALGIVSDLVVAAAVAVVATVVRRPS